jgi:hypothetical protein
MMNAVSFRGILAMLVLVLTGLSGAWTTWKSRRALRKSLGREIRPGEETSLKTWMSVSSASLEEAGRELEENPFEKVLDTVGRREFPQRDTERPSLK